MAKVRKNKIVNLKSITNNKKLIKQFNLKECSVKLERLKTPHENIFKKRINLSIKNGKLKVNDVEIDEICERVYNFELKISRNDVQVIKNVPAMKIEPPRIQKVAAKTLQQLTDQAWRECKKKKKEDKTVLTIDQFVMAKMSGYSPWPGQIKSFTKTRSSAQIYFFGSNNSGGVKEAEIVPFIDSHEVIRLILLRPRQSEFAKGIREIELMMNIPVELSITNQEKTLTN